MGRLDTGRLILQHPLTRYEVSVRCVLRHKDELVDRIFKHFTKTVPNTIHFSELC